MTDRVEAPLRNPTHDLLVALCGLITTLATALLLWQWETRGGVSFYSVMWWLVIPVGAFISGVAAASGYLAGAWLFGRKPTRWLLLNVVLAAASTFFLIHYLSFLTLEIEGQPLRDLVGFGEYLDFAIRSMSYGYARDGASGNELGGFGYVLAGLQVIGFSAGGIVVYRYLGTIPHCDDCGRYFSDKGRQERYFGDPQSERTATVDVLQALHRGDVAAAIDLHGHLLNAKGHLRASFAASGCGGCGRHNVRYSVEHLNGSEWKELPQFAWQGTSRMPVDFLRTGATER